MFSDDRREFVNRQASANDTKPVLQTECSKQVSDCKATLLNTVAITAAIWGETGEAFAQCVATTDCASLGYTETSCPNGKGLKCPFGNKFACPATDESVYEKYGFKYACKGSNEKPGDYTCGGKFNVCKCQSGYTWKDGKCSSGMSDCVIGAIYYADDTCSTNLIENKFPLGIVVYADGKGHGQVMALNNYRGEEKDTIYRQYSFQGSSDNYIRSDTNMTCYAQEAQAKADLASCGNMDMMNNAMDEVIAKKHAEGAARVDRSYIFTLVNNINTYNEQNHWEKKWCIPSLGTYIKMADKQHGKHISSFVGHNAKNGKKSHVDKSL